MKFAPAFTDSRPRSAARLGGLFGVVFVIALALAPTAQAQMVTLTSNGNVFLSGTLSFNSSSVGGGFTADKAFDNLVGITGSNVDNGLIFSDGTGAAQLVAVSGFTATSVGQLWFYTRVDDSSRAPVSVHVYASTTSTTSLSSASYETDLGSFTLGLSFFSTSASVTSGSSSSSYGIANVSASSGTQSLLFDFGVHTTGARLTEIQGFAAPVPEPSTYAALAGLLAVSAALYTRHRRKPAV